MQSSLACACSQRGGTRAAAATAELAIFAPMQLLAIRWGRRHTDAHAGYHDALLPRQCCHARIPRRPSACAGGGAGSQCALQLGKLCTARAWFYQPHVPTRHVCSSERDALRIAVSPEGAGPRTRARNARAPPPLRALWPQPWGRRRHGSASARQQESASARSADKVLGGPALSAQ